MSLPTVVDMGPLTFPLTIDSASVNQSATDFSVNFPKALDCSKGRYSAACTFLSFWNVQQNINQTEFNNTTFEWSPDNGAVFYTGTLPNGTYGAQDLIDTITAIIALAPAGGGDDVANAIGLFINQPSSGFGLSLATIENDPLYVGNTPQIDFSAGGTSDLYLNLGADPIVYSTLGTLLFPFAGDLLNGVSSYEIQLDIIGNSYKNGQPSKTFFSFAPVGTPPGGAYVQRVTFPVFYQVNVSSISTINVRIVDQLGRTIQLQPDGNFQNNATVIEILVRKDM
jgi:hypothetical protein